ncbi:MAG: hypothetical protein AB9869_07565 [Verrucomicrobiia bacterium]
MKLLPSKNQLAQKLHDYPMLRLLLFEKWFRVAIGAFLLLLIFLALFLPKIWRASEPDFLPVIKVSGLDLVQAWSLRRTAEKASDAGNYDEAHYAWQAALANNRADAGLVRGALHTLLKDPKREARAAQAAQEAFWLIRLTKTNITDLELAGRVLSEFELNEALRYVLAPHRSQLTPPLAAAYLKALFKDGQIAEFGARWNELGARVQDDPEIPLYRAAYLAGWGPPGTITEARQTLEAALQDPARRVLANRLKLAVSARELKTDDYGQALKVLQDWRADEAADHTVYWILLDMAGRGEEARRLAKEYSEPPSTARDVVGLAEAYSRLGMRNEALAILEQNAQRFERSVLFWVTYADHLAEAKRWDDLRKIAMHMRSIDGIRDQLGGYSYFLEGRAELIVGRSPTADAAFEKAAESEFPFTSIGFRVANQLVEYGRAAAAKKVLAQLEDDLQHDASYWYLTFNVADRLKDADLLTRAASKGYELSPTSPVAANNYAAAMIISRENPHEVIKLTMELYAQNPNSLHAVVNHSAALLQNGRAAEAETLLGRVRTNGLNRVQLALYNLDVFEALLQLQRYEQAWAVSDLIDASLLYPTQQKWLESAREKLPPRETAAKRAAL